MVFEDYLVNERISIDDFNDLQKIIKKDFKQVFKKTGKDERNRWSLMSEIKYGIYLKDKFGNIEYEKCTSEKTPDWTFKLVELEIFCDIYRLGKSEIDFQQSKDADIGKAYTLKPNNKKLYSQSVFKDPLTEKLEKYSSICSKNQFMALGIDFEFLSGLDNEDVLKRFRVNDEFKKWDKLIFILTHKSGEFIINKNPHIKEAENLDIKFN